MFIACPLPAEQQLRPLSAPGTVVAPHGGPGFPPLNPSCILPAWGSPLPSPRPEHSLSPFCVILQFEMLTGSLPFQGKDRKETMALVLK